MNIIFTKGGISLDVIKRGSIKKKITTVLLIVAMLALGISISISYIGMTQMKKKSLESSENLGYETAQDTKELLIQEANSSLKKSALEKAAFSNEKLSTISEKVTFIANYLTDIYQYPDKYGSIHIEIPLLENDKKPALQFSHIEGVTYEDVRNEAEKAGMFYYIVKHIFNANEQIISSIYFGSASGFMISYDKNSGVVYKDNPDDPSLLIDYVIKEREWYMKAEQAGKTTLIETYYDTFGRLVLSCSAPVFQSNAETVGVLAMDILIEDINKEVTSVKIGENGYAMLINENGQIISAPNLTNEDAKDEFLSITSISEDFSKVFHDMEKGKTGLEEIKIDDSDYYMAYAPVKVADWTLITVIPKQEVIQPALDSYDNVLKVTDNSTQELSGILKTMGLIFFAVCLILMLGIFLLTIRLSNKIAKPIKTLTNDVKRISDGDLEYRTNIKTGDEIELLGDAFNNMTDSLKDYIFNYAKISADKEKIATELNVATTIQKSMLPNKNVIKDEYELSAEMNPAKEVGGDFYDYFVTKDDKLWIVIADVSGKGIPAALFMIISKTLIKNQANYSLTPAEVLENVNNQLCKNNQAEMFVTAFIAQYDFNEKKLKCANAGHNLPLIYRENEGFQWLRMKPGFVLGGLEDIRYDNLTISLDSGNQIFLYTDGVTEALDKEKSLYGEERLINKLNSNQVVKFNNMIDILTFIKDDIKEFVKEEEQADDITILMLKIK